MSRFQVDYSYEYAGVIEVEAESFKDAEEKVLEMEGNLHGNYVSGSFVVGYIDEVEILSSEQQEEQYFEYLDMLRESVVTNMFGAGSYLEGRFGLNRKEASKVLSNWMNTFSERHPA